MSNRQVPTVSRSDALPIDRDSMRIAAVDIGSNSIHMIVVQVNADGTLTTLWRVKEPVGLGRLSFPSHNLTREAMQQGMAALTRIQQAANQRRVEKIIAVATSAVREAVNGGEFIRRIRRKMGLWVKIISAREEARLIYQAVRHAAPLTADPQLVIDVGGGSVELIVGTERQSQLLDSRKLGAARMTARFVHSDPISEEDLATLRQHYQTELASTFEQIEGLKPVGVIGTSGTLENIAAMCAAFTDGAPPDGAPSDMPVAIERPAFQKMFAELVASRSKDRAKMRGLDPQRQDQIVAGAVLIDEIFKRLHLRRIRICKSALREGVVLDYVQRHIPELAVRREVPDPRRRSVLDLARRCDWNRPHLEHVTHLTLQLFDELKPLHGLGAADRELIEYGSLLHDIGWHIAAKGHHKHSMYLILNGGLKGFTKDEIAVIANIARYHRKAIPKKTHDVYQALASRSRRLVDVGAGMLRVADGLDRTHNAVIQDVHAKIDDDEVALALGAKSDAALELWAAMRKRDLFEQTFERRLKLTLGRK